MNRRSAWSLAVLAVVGTSSCASPPALSDDVPLEDNDPMTLTWVAPLATDVVDVGDPLEMVVSTQNPGTTVVHFAVDGAEVGACDGSNADDPCHDEDAWRWTTSFDAPGSHTLVASFTDAAGRVVTISRDVTVQPPTDDGALDPGEDPDAPDPTPDDQLVLEGTGDVVQADSAGGPSDVGHGHIDPSHGLENVFGGRQWRVSNGRILLEHGRLDGSSSTAARCFSTYRHWIEQYGAHYVSRATVTAALMMARDCSGGDANTVAHPLVTASTCAAVSHQSAASCTGALAHSADAQIRMLIEYLSKSSVRRRHHGDPVLTAAVINRGAVRRSRSNAWHIASSSRYLDHFVADYNAYRTWVTMYRQSCGDDISCNISNVTLRDWLGPQAVAPGSHLYDEFGNDRGVISTPTTGINYGMRHDVAGQTMVYAHGLSVAGIGAAAGWVIESQLNGGRGVEPPMPTLDDPSRPTGGGRHFKTVAQSTDLVAHDCHVNQRSALEDGAGDNLIEHYLERGDGVINVTEGVPGDGPGFSVTTLRVDDARAVFHPATGSGTSVPITGYTYHTMNTCISTRALYGEVNGRFGWVLELALQ